MITLENFVAEVKKCGTPEAQILLTEELLASSQLAKKLAGVSRSEEDDIFEEIACLLICHRGMVLANYMMERASGVDPLTAKDLGPVLPKLPQP